MRGGEYMEETQNSTNIVSTNKRRFNPTILIGIVLAVIVIGGLIAFKNEKNESKEESTQAMQKEESTESPTKAVGNTEEKVTETSPKPSDTMAASEKVFTVKGSNYAFSPSKISVNKGDKVKIIFQDDDGFHDLVIDGYNASTKRLQTGGTAEIQFVADKTGTFEYFCSVADHREQGMKGTFTVL